MTEEELILLNKLKNWCAYQERCQFDVREKLWEEKINSVLQDRIIAILIEENFINEERFSRAFASGKFRIKKWGRLKIKTHLKHKKISEYSINKALGEINAEEYFNSLKELLEKKSLPLTQERDSVHKKYKLVRFAQSKGFETDLIIEAINELR